MKKKDSSSDAPLLPNEQLIIDMGVYTKNRNFRIFNSTKLGANRPLLCALSNKFQFRVSTRPSDILTVQNEKELFECSLISNTACHPVLVKRAKLFKPLSIQSPVKFLEYTSEASNKIKSKSPRSMKSVARPSTEPSPFPFLDMHVEKVWASQ